MSADDNDPRVTVFGGELREVRTPDRGAFDVYEAGSTGHWWTVWAVKSPMVRVGRTSLDEAHGGPFPSCDAAIASLIGPPQGWAQ